MELIIIVVLEYHFAHSDVISLCSCESSETMSIPGSRKILIYSDPCSGKSDVGPSAVRAALESKSVSKSFYSRKKRLLHTFIFAALLAD